MGEGKKRKTNDLNTGESFTKKMKEEMADIFQEAFETVRIKLNQDIKKILTEQLDPDATNKFKLDDDDDDYSQDLKSFSDDGIEEDDEEEDTEGDEETENDELDDKTE
jgi:hypothetical protein